MEDKLRALHTKSLELETQLQVEAMGKRSAEDANRDLATDAENARQSLRELQGKVGGRKKSSNESQISCLISRSTRFWVWISMSDVVDGRLNTLV